MVGAGHRSDDRGFTIIELMMSSALLLIALLMFTSALSTVQRASRRQSDLSSANDQARLAIQEIDRQVRSGYVTDAASPDPDFPDAAAVARIYTESRPGGAGARECVAWLLFPASGQQSLYSRSWVAGAEAPTFDPDAPTSNGWRIVADSIVNGDLDANDETFVLSGEVAVGTPPVLVGQVLSITLWLDPSGTGDERAIEITSEVAARNTNRALSDDGGTPVTLCA